MTPTWIASPDGIGSGTPPDLQQLLAELDESGPLVGWVPLPQATCDSQGENCVIPIWGYITMMSGWVVTALATALGAPFWFDVLNKFMVIRSTVKPREKSREEGSEDRRAAARLP